MCGIGAVVHKADNVGSILYELLFNLQHRGQDSSGMISYDRLTGQTYELKDFGLVDKHIGNLNTLVGNMAIGHVRYPTTGLIRKDEIQPFLNDGISIAHNGNLTNLDKLMSVIYDNDINLVSTSDSEILLKLFILFLKKEIINIQDITFDVICQVVNKIYSLCEGSYSVVIMINNYGIVAFRDVYGIRPLVYSENDECVSIASETIGLVDDNYINIKNGEVVVVKPDLIIENRRLYCLDMIPCLFEYIYFARPESYINDVLVYEFREKIADKLVNQLNLLNIDISKEIDCVVPVPQTGLISAMRCAELINKPTKHAIIKNRYMHRTFINPDKKTIVKNMKKIKIIGKLVKGKNLLVIDDSIVRGNTSKYILNELKKCGTKKIFLASCCPPIRNPNIYGIAIPSHGELIAHNKTESMVEKELGVDKLFYLDLESLCDTLRELNPDLCKFETSVFTGKYIEY